MPDSLTSDDMWPLQPKAKKVDLDDAEIDSADEMPAAAAAKPAPKAAPSKPAAGKPAAGKPVVKPATAAPEAPTKPVLKTATRPASKPAIEVADDSAGVDDIPEVPASASSSGTGATGAFRAASATRKLRNEPKPEFAEFRTALLEEAERVRKSGIDKETALVIATKLRRLANEVYHLGKALGYI